jgi:hypothetical protein
MLNNIVEWLRAASAIMAGAKYGHIARIFLHPIECDLSGDMDAGSSRTSMFCSMTVMATEC